MLTAYERMEGGAVVWRCYDYGSEVELPETVEGLPVAELAPYAFSAHMDGRLLEKEVQEDGIRGEGISEREKTAWEKRISTSKNLRYIMTNVP